MPSAHFDDLHAACMKDTLGSSMAVLERALFAFCYVSIQTCITETTGSFLAAKFYATNAPPAGKGVMLLCGLARPSFSALRDMPCASGVLSKLTPYLSAGGDRGSHCSLLAERAHHSRAEIPRE